MNPLDRRSTKLPSPNLLFVFPDQMRGSAMGFLGEEPVQTPFLDSFARESVVFTSAVSNFPVCSPWRAMFLTGQWPWHNGVTGNCHSNSSVELREDSRCWPDVLAAAGYHCGWIGKWHLDRPRTPYVNCLNNQGEPKWNEWCPPGRRHGFAHWYAYGTYDYHLRPLYWKTDAPREGFHLVDQWGPQHEADQALEFLKQAAIARRETGRPFALVVSMNPPHTPYNAVPDKYLEPYRAMTDEALVAGRPSIHPAGTRWGDHTRRVLRHYYAAVTGVDEQFGRILAGLDALGLAEDTVVVFTSDHGDCLGFHGIETKPAPFEEAVRVPLVIRWPGRIMPRRDGYLLSAPDLAPSLLGLVGLGEMIPPNFDGSDLSEMILGGTRPLREAQILMGSGDRDLSRGWRGWRTSQHTLFLSGELGSLQCALCDRDADPFQVDNIAFRERDLVRALTNHMHEWMYEHGDHWRGLHVPVLQ